MYCLYNGCNPVLAIREALAACADQPAPPAHANLAFLQDEELRVSIQQDVTGAHQALLNAEWKAVCILSGAAVEALLHWRIAQIDEARTATGRDYKKPFDRWGLQELIAAAEQYCLLSPEAANQVRSTQDFRNLIHPGRAERTGLRPTRSAAYTSMGGMEAVIEALS